MEVIEKIIKHKGIKDQIAEWQELNIVKGGFSQKEIIKSGKLNKDFQTLPVDTKHFKDLEIEVIGLFDDLDQALDGRLIKSDNFQALNTLLSKYKGQVQTTYIDPPFNLDESASFDYLVNYKDSTWATLLENRLSIAKFLLADKGSIFVRCDYNGNHIVRCLLDSIINKTSKSREIILRKANSQGALGNFNPANESLFFYQNSEQYIFNTLSKNRNRDIKWVNCLSPKENKEANTVVVRGKEYISPKGQHWRFSQSKFDYLDSVNRLRINGKTNIPQYLESEDISLDTNWTDVQGYSFTNKFQTENAEIILQRVIDCTRYEKSLVLDFFLGSGTTTAVAHKLGNRWLGFEIGEQFYNIIIPRMKKVLMYDSTGISKEIEEYKGGGFFKYYELEQYEDALKKAVYNPTSKELENIDFSLSEKQAKVALDIDLKKETAKFVFEKLYPDVDIPETISNLFGKKIKKISKDSVIFEDDMEIDLNNLDFEKYEPLKKLIYW
jgi:adenine specific DNA methylase Mod